MLKVLIINVMLISLFLNLVISNSIHFKEDETYALGDKCQTKPDNQTGICERYSNCISLKTKVEKSLVVCSYDKIEPIICCRKQQENIVDLRRISERKCNEYKEGYIKTKGLPPRGIVNGETTKPSEFPHMAAVGWKITNNSIEWKCGGSLISEKFILTAAHCASDHGIAPSVIRIGDQNLVKTDDGASPEEFEIIRIIKHPQFKPPSVYNDIALIELNSTVNFNFVLRPACLWQNNAINYTNVIATGWGRLDHGRESSEELQKVELSLVKNNVCTTFFEITRRLKDGIINSQICVGDSDGGGKDTCEGDSGGPIQVNDGHFYAKIYHIVGVTSFGKICGSSAPSVYTRVSSFLDWIESVVWPKIYFFFSIIMLL